MNEELQPGQNWALTGELQGEWLMPPAIEPLSHDDPTMRVTIGVPMERTITQEAFYGFAAVFQRGWSIARLPYTRNDIARHKYCLHLLHGDYTHLLMLDSDHVHPADIVERLARWFKAYPQVEVVGGLNFRRGEPYDPCAFVDPGDGTFHRLAGWAQGAIRVDALGSGSIMIARSALEKLPEKDGWWDYDYPDHSGWPGTDMTFSRKCREHGIALWCDTTTTSPHISTTLIDEATYRAWLKTQHPETERAMSAMEVRVQ